MGKSPQRIAIENAAAQTKELGNQAYGIALPTIGSEYSKLNQAMGEGGQPQFISDAYNQARGGILEGSALSQEAARKDQMGARRGAVGGGNFSASISPSDAGARLAQALYGTRVQQASGAIEQQDKLMQMALGQSAQTGSGALQATGNELQNIGYMQPYNSTYANVLGALNTAGTVYGAGKQAGWFSPNGQDTGMMHG